MQTTPIRSSTKCSGRLLNCQSRSYSGLREELRLDGKRQRVFTGGLDDKESVIFKWVTRRVDSVPG